MKAYEIVVRISELEAIMNGPESIPLWESRIASALRSAGIDFVVTLSRPNQKRS